MSLRMSRVEVQNAARVLHTHEATMTLTRHAHSCPPTPTPWPSSHCALLSAHLPPLSSAVPGRALLEQISAPTLAAPVATPSARTALPRRCAPLCPLCPLCPIPLCVCKTPPRLVPPSLQI